MKRIQIHLDEQLDRAASAEASRRGQSKAALIRDALSRELDGSRDADDPWAEITGWLDDDPVEDIDDLIYRQKG
jgi:hypothetical protein